MDEREHDEAIRRETEALDRDLVKFVVDELCRRQFVSGVALSDETQALIDNAFAEAARKQASAIEQSAIAAQDRLMQRRTASGESTFPPSGEQGGHPLRKMQTSDEPGGRSAGRLVVAAIAGLAVVAAALLGIVVWQTNTLKRHQAAAQVMCRDKAALAAEVDQAFGKIETLQQSPDYAKAIEAIRGKTSRSATEQVLLQLDTMREQVRNLLPAGQGSGSEARCLSDLKG